MQNPLVKVGLVIGGLLVLYFAWPVIWWVVKVIWGFLAWLVSLAVSSLIFSIIVSILGGIGFYLFVLYLKRKAQS
jgi:hypothetical protein